jgi:hypothetical protein
VELETFIRLRPFAYHLTAREHAAQIRRDGVILCATEILRRAGRATESSRRRRGPTYVRVNEDTFVVRDQDPLNEGHIAFEHGWDLPRLCGLLNCFVFFWPGGPDGPIPAGVNHFVRYAEENPEVLRVSTRDLVVANAASVRFSRCNSGSPRSNPVTGKAPRGATTFLDADRFDGSPGSVVELVIEGKAVLPANAEWLTVGPFLESKG